MNRSTKISAVISLTLCSMIAQATENVTASSERAVRDQPTVLHSKSNLQSKSVEVVKDEQLAFIRGKNLAGITIVGLQLQLLSQWQANGNRLEAGGVLQVVRVGNGYEIQMGSHAAANAGDAAWTSQSGAAASGAAGLQISGIGQVSQLAGDNNHHGNMTVIDFTPQDLSTQLNGQASSQAGDDTANVRVNFSSAGASLEMNSSQSHLMQQVAVGNGENAAGIMQVGSLVGDNQNSSNLLRLHIMTAPTSTQASVQSNVLQALQLIQIPKP
jgi:hypothetical protein